jgi:tetratricopeptide (TPR) repeat protein
MERADIGEAERKAYLADAPGPIEHAYFRLGALEEQEGAFERALADFRACGAESPTSSFSRSARNRIGWIGARSEGEFAPLARLHRVRRDPALVDEPAALEGLASEAEDFPPGRVRAEARMFVAEAWLARTNKRDAAIALLRAVADDPSSDSMDAALARRRFVQVLVADGRLDAAADEVRTHRVEPPLAADVRRLLRRRMLQRLALAGLLGLVAVAIAAAIAAVVRARRLRAAPALQG